MFDLVANLVAGSGADAGAARRHVAVTPIGSLTPKVSG